jgi:benzoyl-CoA 2,3-dioxygenase component B
VDGEVRATDVPALSALNMRLRDDYVKDCQKGVDRWNRTLAEVGLELRLPHEGFNRKVGVYAGHHVTPHGEVVDEATWQARADEWLPTPDSCRSGSTASRISASPPQPMSRRP